MTHQPPLPRLGAGDGPAELFRLLAVLDVLALIVAGVYLFLSYRHVIPTPLRRASYPFALFGGLVALGVIVNYLSPIPPTPGVKVIAVGGAVCAAWVWVIVARLARR